MGTHTPRPPNLWHPPLQPTRLLQGSGVQGGGGEKTRRGRGGGGCGRVPVCQEAGASDLGDSVRASTVRAQEAAVNVGLRRGNSSQLYFPFRGEKR